jgi:hypothetical protein
MDYSVARSLPYRTPNQVAFENVIAGDERLLVLMEWKTIKFEPTAMARLKTVQIPRVTNGAIQIDGYAEDWAGIPIAVTDPAGDKTGDGALQAGTDLANVYLAHDDNNMYIRMTMHDHGPSAETMYVVELQQYLLQLHTPGDVVTSCVGEPNGPNWGVGVVDRNGRRIAHYPPGTGYCATGDGWLEWKVPIADFRSLTPLMPYYPPGEIDKGIENRFIRIYIHPGPHPNPPPVSDDIEPLAQPLIVDFYD